MCFFNTRHSSAARCMMKLVALSCPWLTIWIAETPNTASEAVHRQDVAQSSSSQRSGKRKSEPLLQVVSESATKSNEPISESLSSQMLRSKRPSIELQGTNVLCHIKYMNFPLFFVAIDSFFRYCCFANGAWQQRRYFMSPHVAKEA